MVITLVSNINFSNLGENFFEQMLSNEDFECEFDISQELFNDFNERNITKENYLDLLDFCANQLLCNEAHYLIDICVDLFGLDIINTIPKQVYLQLSNRELNNQFTEKSKFKKAKLEWKQNPLSTFNKFGHIKFWYLQF